MSERVVLVVESDPTAAEIFQSLIETRLGITAILARDGPDALRKIERLAPALVIVDAVLPGMGGLDITHQIRVAATERNIPTLLVANPAELRQNNVNLDAANTIRKPLNVDHLLRTLRRALPGEEYLEDNCA